MFFFWNKVRAMVVSIFVIVIVMNVVIADRYQNLDFFRSSGLIIRIFFVTFFNAIGGHF